MRRRQAYALKAQEASEVQSPEAFSIPEPVQPVKQEKKIGRPRGSKNKNRK